MSFRFPQCRMCGSRDIDFNYTGLCGCFACGTIFTEESTAVQETGNRTSMVGQHTTTQPIAQMDYKKELAAFVSPPFTDRCETGYFSVHGKVCDRIDVDVAGLGRIELPLCREQAATLISHMSQAPFGKGMETIVDVDVRRAWQLCTRCCATSAVATSRSTATPRRSRACSGR
jgi:hypothetical protein